MSAAEACGIEASRTRKSEFPLVEMGAAVSTVLEQATKVAEQRSRKLRIELASGSALKGQVLADDVTSIVSHPPFRASIFDGYAVPCVDDSSTLLRVRSSISAGDKPVAHALSEGEAVWITTGAPVPPATHCVVKVEDTEHAADTTMEGAFIRLKGPLPPAGDGIREPGSDITQGTTVLTAGTVLTAADMGVALAAGHSSLPVRPRVTVGVMSTGSELQDAAQCDAHATGQAAGLQPGKIYDSNRAVLLQLVRDAGCLPVDLGIVADSAADTTAALRRALASCDVVLTSGGVSMGDKDFVKLAAKELTTVHFGRLFMKPGKPTVFGVASSAAGSSDAHSSLLFALPGNPVSTWVTFHLLVLPALKVLSGAAASSSAVPPVMSVTSLSALRLDRERPEYHRVMLHTVAPPAATAASTASDDVAALTHGVWWGGNADLAAGGGGGSVAPGLTLQAGDVVAVSTGMQRSSRLLSTRGAAGLLVLPPARGGQSRVEIGQRVPCIVLQPPTALAADAQAALFATVSSALSSGVAQETVCGCGAVHGEGGAAKKQGGGHPSHAEHTSVKESPSTAHRRPPVQYALAVITVSDRASAGVYEDKSGPAAVRSLGAVQSLQAAKVSTTVVSDEPAELLAAVQRVEAEHADNAANKGLPLLVVTSGGTGFTQRDRTPETLSALIDKPAPGLVHLLMSDGLRHTPLAVLARPVAGVTHQGNLLVTLPGKPKAVVEGVQALAGVLPHALKLLVS